MMAEGSDSENKENLDISRSQFVVPPTPLLKKVACGTGVSVYFLDRSPVDHKLRSPWALKKVNKTHKGGEISKRMFDESIILKNLNHPNIVGFRGYTKTEDGREVLALESCSKCLGDLIEERQESGLMKRFLPQEILKVAKGMAQGLHYLHTVAHVMHGDIKSYNVLIKDRNFRQVKLCDFGVSLQVNDEGVPCDKESADNYMGTAAWSAPEVLGEGPVTTKSDIFSLGMTLWEMMTLKPPHLNMSVSEDTGSSVEMDSDFISGTENFGQRPLLPDNLGPDYKEIVKIFNWCTEEDPKKRPTAKELLDILVRIQL